ncbi:uncharacterized mitochondrial protein AtMg00810-like [Magnolia sinica]|uniref:uncharacterized mitochondrial protein AtMg00810-like n=1 Tax=Magnolia sinica TaxID=86752 RepID=UPI00265A783F|nr:uncharacterized mitochondrial protein AtMg00810-like [Magnolia sinica]
MTTVRCLLAVAATQNWIIHQLDVNNAFLHDDLNEEVYMTPPPGCFHQSQADYSLFTLITSTSITLVLVYVGDILVAGTDISQIELFKKILSTHFKTKDLGSFKYFVGLEVAHSPKDSDLLPDLGLFRRLVGRLIYLTITRPDIVYAVNTLSQFMHAFQVPHMTAVTRVLRYIKGYPGEDIFFPSSNSTHVTAYTDSDWVSCPTTRRSTTGYFIQLGTSSISRRTKKQNTVARSFAEAEYRAMLLSLSHWAVMRFTYSEISLQVFSHLLSLQLLSLSHWAAMRFTYCEISFQPRHSDRPVYGVSVPPPLPNTFSCKVVRLDIH